MQSRPLAREPPWRTACEPSRHGQHRELAENSMVHEATSRSAAVLACKQTDRLVAAGDARAAHTTLVP